MTQPLPLRTHAKPGDSKHTRSSPHLHKLISQPLHRVASFTHVVTSKGSFSPFSCCLVSSDCGISAGERRSLGYFHNGLTPFVFTESVTRLESRPMEGCDQLKSAFYALPLILALHG